jgi:hypothetical protein
MVWIVYESIFGCIRVLRCEEDFVFEAEFLDLGQISTNWKTEDPTNHL